MPIKPETTRSCYIYRRFYPSDRRGRFWKKPEHYLTDLPFLVNEIGILPGNILLCYFHKTKAANEMRHRIHNLIADNDTGYINTFHGFCVSILQEDSHAVQYPKNFLVLDNQDIDSMLKIIYEERGLTLRHKTFSKARDMIEMYKLERYPNYYLDLITMSLDTLRQKYLGATDVNDIIFYGYLYQEKKCFGLDYNDLLKFSLYIFEKNKEIRLKWQKTSGIHHDR